MWFNPPYSLGVTTRIGARFLAILDKCFKEDNPLSRILNRHTIKVSYRTTPNMKQIITGHNTHLLAKHKQQGQETEPKTCSCPKSRTEPCPLGGKCLSSCIIYQATVTETESKKSETYIGMTADPFKKRYGNHKKSFKQEKYKTETDLSNHTWKLESEKKSFNINWKILDRGRSFNPGSKICQLCTIEKYYLIFKPELCTLNSHNELGSHCRHKKKLLHSSYF